MAARNFVNGPFLLFPGGRIQYCHHTGHTASLEYPTPAEEGKLDPTILTNIGNEFTNVVKSMKKGETYSPNIPILGITENNESENTEEKDERSESVV